MIKSDVKHTYIDNEMEDKVKKEKRKCTNDVQKAT